MLRLWTHHILFFLGQVSHLALIANGTEEVWSIPELLLHHLVIQSAYSPPCLLFPLLLFRQLLLQYPTLHRNEVQRRHGWRRFSCSRRREISAQEGHARLIEDLILPTLALAIPQVEMLGSRTHGVCIARARRPDSYVVLMM